MIRFGIDVGGTTVKIGVIEDYKFIDHYQIKTNKDTLFKDICLSVKDYMTTHNINEIEGIGFGLPGVVKNNYIYLLPNIGIKNFDLANEINKYLPGIKMASNNDANVAALGEAINDNNTSSSYMITLGTGVGGGLVIDGHVIEGAHAACGEVGHMFVDHIHNYKCGCGLSGCWETVCSATGVVRLAKQYYYNYKTSMPFDMSCKDVFDYAKLGDELALVVVDMVSNYLGLGLSMIAVTVDVDAFYIGGGVAACGNILLDGVKKYYKKYAHFAVRDTEIKLAKLGNLAGMLGAAYIL